MHFPMRFKPPCAALAILILSLAPREGAYAQDVARPGPPPESGWRIDVGAGVLASPAFPGAKDERVLPIPSIEIHYRDRFFASIREGVGYNLVRWNGLAAGPVVNFAFPRNVSAKPAALRGLGDVALTFEAGGFVRYDAGRVASAQAEVRQGVNGHKGLVVDGAIHLNAPPLAGNRLFLSAGPRFSYYGQRYVQAYYGVTTDQAAQSGYAVFHPHQGYRAGVGAAAISPVTHHITLTAFGGYDRLLGDIDKSPIVLGRYGARDQFAIGTSASYRFRIGG